MCTLKIEKGWRKKKEKCRFMIVRQARSVSVLLSAKIFLLLQLKCARNREKVKVEYYGEETVSSDMVRNY